MTGPARKAKSEVERLALELRWVTRRRLPEVFKDPTKRDTAKFPILANAVQKIAPDTWQEDPTRALIRVVGRVVNDYLPDNMYPQDKSGMWQSHLSWRDIGKILCGFRTYLPPRADGSSLDYDYYVNIVKERSGFAQSTHNQDNFRRDVSHPFRLLLAQKLLDLADSGLPGKAAPIAAPDYTKANPLYVPRERLHTQFKSMVDRGAKLIVLYGLPGIGKTWLATALVPGAPRIRVLGGQLFIPDLYAALVAQGFEMPESISDRPEEYLARLLCGPQAPAFVVLDNLDSADQLHGLLPASTTTTVVATCRAKGMSPPTDCRFIRVTEMTNEEAIEMITLLLPGSTQDDASRLVSTSGAYPLMLSYACALIRNTGLSVENFYKGFNPQRPGSPIASIPTEYGDSLVGVLTKIVSVIADRDPVAFEMLVCLAFAGRLANEVFQMFLAFYIYWFTLEANRDAFDARFHQALAVLLEFSLVRTAELPDDLLGTIRPEEIQYDYLGQYHNKSIAIHPVTRTILHQLFYDRLPQMGVRTVEIAWALEKPNHFSARKAFLAVKKRDAQVTLNTYDILDEYVPAILANPSLANDTPEHACVAIVYYLRYFFDKTKSPDLHRSEAPWAHRWVSEMKEKGKGLVREYDGLFHEDPAEYYRCILRLLSDLARKHGLTAGPITNTELMTLPQPTPPCRYYPPTGTPQPLYS